MLGAASISCGSGAEMEAPGECEERVSDSNEGQRATCTQFVVDV